MSIHKVIYALLTAVISVILYQHAKLKHKTDQLELEKLYVLNKTQSSTHMFGDTNNEDAHKLIRSYGSSVWCSGENHTTRLCRFKNLCFLPQQDIFLFFHAEFSIQDDLPENRFNPALLDLSTVSDHNALYFNYIDVPASAIDEFKNLHYVAEKTLLFNRFLPGNLMHVLHDDLIPLHYTLNQIDANFKPNSSCNMKLVFMDSNEPGEFQQLYELFSMSKPLYKTDVKAAGQLICFHDVHVGLMKSTKWYQYGFKEPQGPLGHKQMNGRILRHFTNYIKQGLGVTCESDSSRYAILLARRNNRMIFNEAELTLKLAQEFDMKVFTVSFETHTLTDMIRIICSATILIGMHGSLLSLSMFLPYKSVVVELFPYGVNPENYTPYKTLAGLDHTGVVYASWRNMDIKNTITHPEYMKELGGIEHLSKEEQEIIKNMHEVPKHLCCSDPHWLFRIYQDTIVNVPEIINIVRNSLQEVSDLSDCKELNFIKMLPSKALDLSCELLDQSHELHDKAYLNVSWQPPWNLQFLTFKKVEYEVWLQEHMLEQTTAYKLRKTMHTFEVISGKEYVVWVRCVLDDGRDGPFNTDYVKCKT